MKSYTATLALCALAFALANASCPIGEDGAACRSMDATGKTALKATDDMAKKYEKFLNDEADKTADIEYQADSEIANIQKDQEQSANTMNKGLSSVNAKLQTAPGEAAKETAKIQTAPGEAAKETSTQNEQSEFETAAEDRVYDTQNDLEAGAEAGAEAKVFDTQSDQKAVAGADAMEDLDEGLEEEGDAQDSGNKLLEWQHLQGVEAGLNNPSLKDNMAAKDKAENAEATAEDKVFGTQNDLEVETTAEDKVFGTQNDLEVETAAEGSILDTKNDQEVETAAEGSILDTKNAEKDLEGQEDQVYSEEELERQDEDVKAAAEKAQENLEATEDGLRNDQKSDSKNLTDERSKIVAELKDALETMKANQEKNLKAVYDTYETKPPNLKAVYDTYETKPPEVAPEAEGESVNKLFETQNDLEVETTAKDKAVEDKVYTQNDLTGAPKEPTVPPVKPTNPPVNDCAVEPPFTNDCPADIELLHVNGTHQIDVQKVIKIVEQKKESVVISLVNNFSEDGNISQIWYQYKPNMWNEKCFEEDSVCPGSTYAKEIELYCLHSKAFTHFEICLADEFLLDNSNQAKVPKCCKTKAPEGTPVVCYTFMVACDSDFTSECIEAKGRRNLRGLV